MNVYVLIDDWCDIFDWFVCQKIVVFVQGFFILYFDWCSLFRQLLGVSRENIGIIVNVMVLCFRVLCVWFSYFFCVCWFRLVRLWWWLNLLCFIVFMQVLYWFCMVICCRVLMLFIDQVFVCLIRIGNLFFIMFRVCLKYVMLFRLLVCMFLSVWCGLLMWIISCVEIGV